MKLKDVALLLLIIVLTTSLIFVGKWTNGIVIFDSLSGLINQQIAYQAITLLYTILFLFILWWFKRAEFQSYFRKGNISAEISPVPMVGIKPKPNENWFHFGRNIGIIISVVTAIVIYFQIIKGNEISGSNILTLLLFSIVFSLSNSFVEESITRLGVVVLLKGKLKERTIPLISALIFGIVHYWGNPGGIAGVIVAGFLGWFLAKSILETKGIFWAWLIHFVQDVIIFSARFLVTP
ncbi:MAG TPA: CPBP family intramembrane metalloprotease [Bacteroidales bacterium]|nr:MAG: CAAX amino terminal protease self- immunity [Bacteroidetes bacterium ADurb.Bin041]HNV49684.1 CPBP family intramembrane metalloprotease [Bacteroidales bacterium]HPW42446.1 CPBP family intramembrane metalloprotease [Bacteroidales bacterium]